MSLDFLLKNTLRTTAAHFKKLEKLGIITIRDFLEFFPRAIEASEITSNFNNVKLNEKNTISGIITNIRQEKSPRKGRKLGKASLVLDDKTEIAVIWFSIPYILKNLRAGSRVFLVGRISRNYGEIQISNPEIHLDKNVHVGKVRAIYPESPPLTAKWWREKMSELLIFTKDFPEILPQEIIQNENFLSKHEAISNIHSPKIIDDWQEAKRRLAFEEVFEIQTRVISEKIKRERSTQNNFQIKFDAETIKTDLAKLPFELTLAQKKSLWQILQDFEKDRPSHRLVQGDVGSGKTIVAFLSANAVVRAGHQVAILAPTEILATQHFAEAADFWEKKENQTPANPQSFFPDLKNDTEREPKQFIIEGENTNVALLTGSTPAKQKRIIKEKLANGTIQVLIGTHAILTEDTVFKDLGLAIIDEQHRFGVAQRSTLSQNNSHQVAMTATPIPRTLALTIYGDQDLSIIDQMPPGRKPIITRVVSSEKIRQKMNLFIDDQISKKRQIFWVCPLVDESDKIEAKNVKEEFDRIANDIFPNRRVEFLHGKMRPKEKDEIMQRFSNKEADILVSTSVIEVGVNIPDATVMVIENAERFGLSQLHQFRGRIGRNKMQSYCFLMTGKKDDAQKERLKAMEKSNSGFYLAEIDLKLRGAGEMYGTKQSGVPDLKCADLTDVKMLEKAREWAIKICEQDITLNTWPELKKRIESGDIYF